MKAKRLKKPKISRSLRSFIETYYPEEAWLANLSLNATLEVEGNKVYFRPWYDLVEE